MVKELHEKGTFMVQSCLCRIMEEKLHDMFNGYMIKKRNVLHNTKDCSKNVTCLSVDIIRK